MNKKIKIYLIGTLFIIISIAFYKLLNVYLIIDNSNMKIVMISKSKYGEKWESITSGAKAAANEYGVDIQFLAPDYEKDNNLQNSLIKSSLEEKNNGIIIAPINADEISKIIKENNSNKIPVINIMSETNVSYVGINNYETGETIAQELVNAIGNTGKVIILSSQSENDIVLREKGLVDYINAKSKLDILEICYYQSNEAAAYNNTYLLLNKYKDVDAIIGLDEIITLGIAKKISEQNRDIYLMGFDINQDIINKLDDRIIDKVIFQNYFSIGYLAVKNIVEQVKRRSDSSKIYIKTNVVTPDNMYDFNMQKVLFPINIVEI